MTRRSRTDQLELPSLAPLPTFKVFEKLGLVTDGSAESWAVFSPDRCYRYLLARFWEDYFTSDPWQQSNAPLMTFVMLNPSVADAAADDPTIRRCLGFAKREHCGGIIVVNLFALISTDPAALLRAQYPVGPVNLEVLEWALLAPMHGIAVAAWGALSRTLHHASQRSRATVRMRRRMRCLGTTKAGHPRHPLYLRGDAPLQEFSPP
jgi:hypothetical protein